jgi:hypothetical protein
LIPAPLAKRLRRRLLTGRALARGAMRTATEAAREVSPYEPRATELLERARELESKAAALVTEALELVAPRRSA